MKLSRLIIPVFKRSMEPKTPGDPAHDIPKVTVFRKAYNQVTFEAGFPRPEAVNGGVCKKLGTYLTCSCERVVSCIYYMLPILYWLPRYKLKRDLPPDLVAGLTVGVMHIPQGMAYSVLAGLDPVYGLYTSFFPPLLYMFLGTSRHVSLGVFAVISLMVGTVRYKHLPEDHLDDAYSLLDMNITDMVLNPDSLNAATKLVVSPLDPTHLTPINIVTALTFAVGCFLALMSIFRLGFVTSYLSDQVVSGFTTGAAFHVFTAQCDKVLNIKLPRHSGLGKMFYVWRDLILAVPRANIATVVMSTICIAFLFIGKQFVNPRLKKYCSIPPPYELMLVIVTTAIAWYFDFENFYRMKVVGEIPTGLPMPSLPHVEYIPHMIADALSISIVVFVVTVSMAKLFAKKHHYKIDANQLATLFSSALLLVVLLWLGPLFGALPTCVLASIIIVALKGMFMQLKQLKELWPVSKIDFAIWMIAFVGTVLLDITYGLGISVCCALFSVVYRTRNASSLLLGKCENNDMITDASLIKVQQHANIKVFRFNAPLLFLNADRLRKRLLEACHMDLDDPNLLLLAPIKTACTSPASSKTDSPENPKTQTAQTNGRLHSDSQIRNIDLDVEGHARDNEQNNADESETKSEESDEDSLDVAPAFHWADDDNVVDEVKEDVSVRRLPEGFPEVIILDCCAISTIDVMGINAMLELRHELKKVHVRLFFASCNVDLLSMFERSKAHEHIPKTDIFPTVDDAIAMYASRTRSRLQTPQPIRDTDISYIKISTPQESRDGHDKIGRIMSTPDLLYSV